MEYNHQTIEEQELTRWLDEAAFAVHPDPAKQKYNVIAMYPYPSGELHMGHVRNYILADVVARYKRLRGFNVLHPIGWDSFGLPTEIAAFQRGIEPSDWNRQCVNRMIEQFNLLGLSYDWSQQIDTSDPAYYKWTQWILIQMWRKGLLYKSKRAVNWCPNCKTVLANEQVEDGLCFRCNTQVEQKEMEQWFLGITKYANRLVKDLDLLENWPERVVTMQRNWIGLQPDGSMRLRDWCISRQRYWATPIPFVECNSCGIVPVPEKDLPVLLPKGADLTPGWPPPLARIPEFYQTTCPQCGGSAERVVDTVDTFVSSAWYYLRYADPHNSENIFTPALADYWLPVDQYVGGIEHATVHLVYARFFHKFFYDLGLVSSPEPFHRLFTQGMVYKDGSKMSKSKGNVVAPDELVRQHGADATRLFSLFLGPPERDVEWHENGVQGCFRFIKKFWRLFWFSSQYYRQDWKDLECNFNQYDSVLDARLSHSISSITESVENNFRFHTAIAKLMDLVTAWSEYVERGGSNAVLLSRILESTTLMITPFTPFACSYLWRQLTGSDIEKTGYWPEVSASSDIKKEVQIVFQVNGKVRSKQLIPYEQSQNQQSVTELALADSKVQQFMAGAKVVKTIFVPGRLINFVV